MTESDINSLVDRLSRTEYDDLDACKAAELIKAQKAIIDKFRTIVAHANAEKTGLYFICGGSDIGTDGLPDTILVCPSFGLDGFARYQKASEYSAPGY